MEVNRTDRVESRIEVRSEKKDDKLGDFKKYTKSYTSISFPQNNTHAHKSNVPDEKRRQLRGQVAGVMQELHNVPERTDTDRRLLNISSAVVFLLAGR